MGSAPIEAEVTAWNGLQIAAQVPSETADGPVVVQAEQGDSNGAPFGVGSSTVPDESGQGTTWAITASGQITTGATWSQNVLITGDVTVSGGATGYGEVENTAVIRDNVIDGSAVGIYAGGSSWWMGYNGIYPRSPTTQSRTARATASKSSPWAARTARGRIPTCSRPSSTTCSRTTGTIFTCTWKRAARMGRRFSAPPFATTPSGTRPMASASPTTSPTAAWSRPLRTTTSTG